MLKSELKMACISLKRSLSYESDSNSCLSGPCKRRKFSTNRGTCKYSGGDSSRNARVSIATHNKFLAINREESLPTSTQEFNKDTKDQSNFSRDFTSSENEHWKYASKEHVTDNSMLKTVSSLSKPPSESTDHVNKGEELLSFKQVGQISENILGKYEAVIRERFDKILIQKLEEQNKSFADFVNAQLFKYKFKHSSQNYYS